jgi:hypothetical protein
MFEVGDLENSIFLLDVLKNDFVEVDEVMFQGIESPCELFFCILVIEKNMNEVA